jgi:hypothetical protein
MSARSAIETAAKEHGWEFVVRTPRRFLLERPLLNHKPVQRISVWFTKGGKIASASFGVQTPHTVVAWSHNELHTGHRKRQILTLLETGVPRLPRITAVELDPGVWAHASFDPAADAGDFISGQRVALHPDSGIVRNSAVTYGFVQGTILHYGTPLVQVLLPNSGRVITQVPWLLGTVTGLATQGTRGA